MAGCVIPGSATGRISVRGRLLAEDLGPLAHEPIDFILPAAYGLGGLDLHFGTPADYGHEDRHFSVQTNERGEFTHSLHVLYHRDLWLIPPRGWRPRRPPPPFLLIRVPRYSGEYYAVQVWNGLYKVFDAKGDELAPEQASLVQMEVALVEDDAAQGPGTTAVLVLRFASSE